MEDCSKELKIFARIMRLKRYEKNLTQEKLAEKMDCNVNAIGKIERGESIPSLRTIINLAKALGISPKDLMPY